GEAVANAGDPAEGERLLRSGIEDGLAVGRGAQGAVFYGRVNLVAMLGHRGDLDEAHALVDTMLDEVRPGALELVRGMLLAVKGWLTVASGDPEAGLRHARQGFDELYAHPMAELFAPRLGIMVVPIVVSM